MHAPKNIQQNLLHRLKIARGHLNKVINMVEKDEYCINIIHQNQAIQSALKEVDTIMLENHLKSCVVHQIKEGKVEKSIEEVMQVFKKTNKGPLT
ncbi:MAG: metal-sensitive transcriptional regulator [Candidatus Roizmanbacteria bacterium]|nr:metal-sensitive transcriptional regulator [Candidatus Roizmanbacteria bacterium]